MADGLLRHMAGDWVKVASAGLGAGHGQPPSANAIEVLGKEGIDITDIRSQPVSLHLLQRADYIFTMTRDHLDMLLLLYPEMASKTRLLRFDEAAKGGRADVTYPIGGTRETYESCKTDIKRAMSHVIPLITGEKNTMNTATQPRTAHEPSDIAAIEETDPAIAAAIHD